MSNHRYFTGTTLENALRILQHGHISTHPPERVWTEHSGEYVYFIDPESVKVDLEYEKGYIERAIVLASDQASYAVWKLNHCRRVVFEVELDPKVCEIDMDAGCSVRVPHNIELHLIRGVYLEREDNSLLLKESIALRNMEREFGFEAFLNDEKRERAMKMIPGLSLVKEEFWQEADIRYDDLVDFQGDLELFDYMNLSAFAGMIEAA